jgi:hypothetical protein
MRTVYRDKPTTTPLAVMLIGGILALRAVSIRGADDNQRAGLDWWALQPVASPPVPLDPTASHPIDRFIRQRLQTLDLSPSATADRATLIRRVTYDLIGLPPTPEEIDAFVSDEAPDAFERLVDRLLASPHYGERWARHWLDVARFGESQGFERDIVRDHSWRYRDYVIRSFNDDLPYDQFVREQIAGDVIEPVRSEGVIATGFLVAGPYDEAGNGSKSDLLRARIREEELEDIISTVSQTFLGLTVHCARCHDHKFDPIPQRDYYRIKAVFDGVRHGNRPALPASEVDARRNQIAALKRSIDEASREIASIERAVRDRLLEEGKSERGDSPAIPAPLARWTFEADAHDEVGGLHGTLRGGATISNGRLILNGKGAYVETTPLRNDVQAKTLEVWAALENLAQRGGGLVSVESNGGQTFDAVVFGEREPGKWIAGSEGFQRTKDLDPQTENTRRTDLVHLVITYDDANRITLYRDGVRYAEPYVPAGGNAGIRKYSAGASHVLFGLRHTGAGNGFFAGEIEEARLYDRALTADEVAASFRDGAPAVSIDRILAAMSDDDRNRRASLVAENDRRRSSLDAATAIPQCYAANPREPEPTYLLVRGDVEKKGELVSPGALSCIANAVVEPTPATLPESQRRVQFAEWLTRPTNPLTARVLVNRVWHYHFGRGLVASPSDFGWNGDRPSHAALLDWLASEFVAGGWSIKKLHKLILTSETYRQASAYHEGAASVDADGRLLWRFPPRRLEGEVVRDAMLAASGQLNSQMHGPSFRPFELKVFNSHFYNLNDPIGPEFNRRTVYRIHVNSAKDPLLDSMDCPDPSTRTPARNVTTTPIQALGLMNNSFVQRQAARFAERLRAECGPELSPQITRAFQLAFGRRPGAAEMQRATELANSDGMETVCWTVFNASEFQYLK